MKELKAILITLAVLLVATGSGYATTTDSIQITSGGLTATFQDNVAGCSGSGCGAIVGDLIGTAGTLIISGTLNGWVISVVGGVSHSPGLSPFGLDITSMTASCLTPG